MSTDKSGRTGGTGGTGRKGWGRVPALARGATVGRYLVLGLIGKGGAGEVYAAYDPELDRKIALKLLRPHTTAGIDPAEGKLRLLREAQAIARLSDPNVVVVFDVGTFEERVFLAMEFVDGNTLGYWLAAKTRTWREIVARFTAAGRGLAAAHKAGLVHRDFKPDNVMIGRDDQVRVMDFGLARTIDTNTDKPADDLERTPSGRSRSFVASSGVTAQPVAREAPAAAPAIPDEEPWREANTSTRNLSRATGTAMRTDAAESALNARLTITGAMMGTPAYMAPEQFQGGAIDARTDQFSFCVALYEGLYGERPFEGRNIHDLTSNVCVGRVREVPDQAKVPGWLRRVLLRGLRVDRTERYASMEDLLAALGRDPARAQRRWAMVAGVAAVIGVLGVGLFRAERRQRLKCVGAGAQLTGVWELPSAKRLSPRKEGIRQAFMATGKPYAADSFTVVRNALDRYVVAWNDMHRDTCEATNVRGEQSAEVLDLRMSCLKDRFSEVRALTSVLGNADGNVVTKSVEAVHAIRPIEPCADIAALRAVLRPPEDPDVRRVVENARAQLANVKALANAGRYKKARDAIHPVVEAARKTKYQPVIAEAQLQLADLQTLAGETSEAEKTYEEAAWLGQASRHGEVSLEAAISLIANVGYSQGRPKEGERWARYAGAMLQSLGPGHELLGAWRANNIAMVHHAGGRFEDALGSFREALSTKTRVLGAVHYDVAVSMANVAFELFKFGRIDEAIAENERALEIFQKTLGFGHPRSAFALSNGADFLNQRGRYDEAQALAEQALEIAGRELDPEHLDLAGPLTAIGLGRVEKGRPHLAIQPLERALMIREAKERDPERLAETRFALARALWDSSKNLDRALALALLARSDYGKASGAEKQMAGVNRWIEARPTRSQLVSRR